MATRNQVLSLFGATPQQVMARQRQRDARFLGQLRDPYQMAGGAIGVGLGRLFGGKSEELQAAEQMKQAVAGVDPNDPEALRELAQTVSGFAPERALQIAAYAGELEKSQMGSVVSVPTIVGYTTEPDIDPMTSLQRIDPETKEPMFKQTPIFRNVPFERSKDGLKSLVPGYSLPSGASTAIKDGVPTPKSQQVDFIVDEDGGFARTATEADQVKPNVVPSTVSPEAAERIDQQSGESRQSMISADNQVFAVDGLPPNIKSEVEYADPKELQQEINSLRAQLNRSTPKKTKDKILKKIRELVKQQKAQKNPRSRRTQAKN